MKLYYKSGACSLAAHIVLHELGLPFEAESVDLATKRTAAGADYLAVNAKGYVPALVLDDGAVLTEGTVVLQYLGDQKPAAGLVPAAGTLGRYRVQEWLGFINSEVHKNFSPFFNKAMPEAALALVKQTLVKRLDFVAQALGRHEYLNGSYSVADAYLYTVLNWAPAAGIDLATWPAIAAWHARVAARPAVKAARAAEGLG
jgi:glutathione S-transferase